MGRLLPWAAACLLAGLAACTNQVVPGPEACNGTFVDISHEFAWQDTASSVAWDGQSFWVSNYAQGSGKRIIYRYDKHTCQCIGSIPSPSEWTSNLCSDGANLWLTDQPLNYLQLLEVSSTDGSRVAAFAAPEVGADPAGIAFDGHFLYYASCGYPTEECTVDKLDPNTGAVLGQIYATSNYGISGITYKDGSLFFLSRSQPGKIVNITLDGVEVSAVDLPATEDIGHHQVVSLANSEGELWYVRALGDPGPPSQQGIVRFKP